MILYKIINKIGIYWVLAEHPTEAEQKLNKVLNDADYGFFEDRKIQTIEAIAESVRPDFIIKKFLIP